MEVNRWAVIGLLEMDVGLFGLLSELGLGPGLRLVVRMENN